MMSPEDIIRVQEDKQSLALNPACIEHLLSVIKDPENVSKFMLPHPKHPPDQSHKKQYSYNVLPGEKVRIQTLIDYFEPAIRATKDMDGNFIGTDRTKTLNQAHLMRFFLYVTPALLCAWVTGPFTPGSAEIDAASFPPPETPSATRLHVAAPVPGSAISYAEPSARQVLPMQLPPSGASSAISTTPATVGRPAPLSRPLPPRFDSTPSVSLASRPPPPRFDGTPSVSLAPQSTLFPRTVPVQLTPSASVPLNSTGDEDSGMNAFADLNVIMLDDASAADADGDQTSATTSRKRPGVVLDRTVKRGVGAVPPVEPSTSSRDVGAGTFAAAALPRGRATSQTGGEPTMTDGTLRARGSVSDPGTSDAASLHDTTAQPSAGASGGVAGAQKSTDQHWKRRGYKVLPVPTDGGGKPTIKGLSDRNQRRMWAADVPKLTSLTRSSLIYQKAIAEEARLFDDLQTKKKEMERLDPDQQSTTE